MIPLFKVFTAPSVKDAIGRVLDSGLIGQYKENDNFEQALREYLDVDYLNTTNSATSAEHLAYHLLKKYGLKEGDEVLTTALTCSATDTPIVANGLKIKWVDIDPKNLNIDLDDLERKLSPNTKVINLVHWGGTPNNLDLVFALREKAYKLYGFYPWIISDCAHALGAKYKGKRIGSHGDICTFSFQAIKLVNSIDGGMLVSPGFEDFYRRGRLLRWFGLDRDDKNQKDMRCFQNCKEAGFKFHMNDVNSVVGIENLKEIDWLLAAHQRNAAFYDLELRNVSGLTLMERDTNSEPSFWIYSMLVEDRDNFNKWMKECGIATSMVHDRVDKHECFKEFRSFLPNLDKVIGKLTHIPVQWALTAEERAYIVDSIKKGW